MSNEEFDAFTYNTLRNFEDIVDQLGVEYVVKCLDNTTEMLLKGFFLQQESPNYWPIE